MFEQLSALAWTTPVRGSVHNLLVDTYAMQHPEEYGRSAKSYAAHLAALCCGVEHAGNQKLYWEIARWLDGPAVVAKPALISDRGHLTIADVATPSSESDYPALVRRWASDVWTAYAAQQEPGPHLARRRSRKHGPPATAEESLTGFTDRSVLVRRHRVPGRDAARTRAGVECRQAVEPLFAGAVEGRGHEFPRLN